MKIVRIPTEYVGRNIECLECGAVFKLHKRDMKKGMFSIVNDGERNRIVMSCPCCNSSILFNEVETAEERAYNDVIAMLQNVAADIKDMRNKEARAKSAEVVDFLYNEIYSRLEELHGKVNKE